jgi:hypothetical protein
MQLQQHHVVRHRKLVNPAPDNRPGTPPYLRRDWPSLRHAHHDHESEYKSSTHSQSNADSCAWSANGVPANLYYYCAIGQLLTKVLRAFLAQLCELAHVVEPNYRLSFSFCRKVG